MLYGGDLELDLPPFQWLDMKTSYSYVIGKRKNGNFLPFTPQNKIKFEIKAKRKKINFSNSAYKYSFPDQAGTLICICQTEGLMDYRKSGFFQLFS